MSTVAGAVPPSFLRRRRSLTVFNDAGKPVVVLIGWTRNGEPLLAARSRNHHLDRDELDFLRQLLLTPF